MVTIAKASVLDAIEGTFAVREYEVPEPAPGTFVLRTELSGVCATDAHMYYGHLAGTPYPIILGHEFCGTIERLGAGVTADVLGKPVREGDRVIVIPGVACGHCYFCAIAKTPTRCANVQAYGFLPDDPDHVLAGGHSQYVYVQVPHTAFLKTSLPPEIAVLAEPLTIAIHGIDRAGVWLGDTAVIQGSGAVGLGALIFAKYAGAAKTIVIGGPAKRLDLAREFGADVVVDISEVRDPQDRTRLVLDETLGRRGADVVFECAGVPSAISEGLGMVRESGRYVELGHFTDVGPATINPHTQMMQKNVNFYACWGGEPTHFIQGLPFLEKREWPYEKIVRPIIPLSREKDAVESIIKRGWRLDGEEVFKVGLDPWL